MLNMLRIGPRLAITFTLGLAMLAFASLLSLREMQSLNAKTQFFTEHIIPSLKIQHAVALDFSAIRRAEVRHVLSDNPVEMADLENQIKTYRQNITRILNEYAGSYVTDAKDQEGLDDWWSHNLYLSDEMSQTATQTYEQTRQMLIGMLVLFLLLGLTAAWFITRSVVTPLKMAVEAAEAAAEGDLTHDPTIRGKDEAADLLAGIRKMNEGLSTLVRDVRKTSESLLKESRDAAQDSTDLSRRTEQQAVALEETSVSIVQIQTAMQRNAESAGAIRNKIRYCVEEMEFGAELVASTSASINHIVTQISQASDFVNEISDTVAQQAESFNQVAIAVKTLQNMTEDNVALVEQGAAAASGLKNQAQILRNTVERFRLSGHKPKPNYATA